MLGAREGLITQKQDAMLEQRGADLGEEPIIVHGIGETVLHFLAVETDQAGVFCNDSAGADINTKNSFGEPVLFEVAALGYKELFTRLVAAGADPFTAGADGQGLVDYLSEFENEDMATWVRSQIPGI